MYLLNIVDKVGSLMKLRGNGFVFAILGIMITALIAVALLVVVKKPYIQASGESKKKIKLRFISSWAGTDNKAGKLEELLKKFQIDNPDIEVVNESMNGDEFLFTLKTDFAEGNDPDVFGLWPGSDIKKLIKAGKVADLTEALMTDMKWYESFGKEIWAYDTFNGKIYGLPSEIIYEGLFINRDIFQKYNVKVPTNYDELKNAVITFKKNGIIPIAYNSMTEGTYLYQNIVMKLAGKNCAEDSFTNGKLDKSFKEAMDYVSELYNMGAFPDNAFTIDNNTRNSLFFNKKAAMIVQGSWFIGQGGVDSNDESVEIVPFPAFKTGNADPSALIYGIGNGNFHISSEAWKDKEKRDACLKLLKALTSEETSKYLSNETGYISNIKITTPETNIPRMVVKGRELINHSKELVGPIDSFVDRTVWEDVLVKKFPLVLEKKITADELISEAEKRMTEAK